jgi:hypothetical protein
MVRSAGTLPCPKRSSLESNSPTLDFSKWGFAWAECNPVQHWAAGLGVNQLGQMTPSTSISMEASKVRPDSSKGST